MIEKRNNEWISKSSKHIVLRAIINTIKSLAIVFIIVPFIVFDITKPINSILNLIIFLSIPFLLLFISYLKINKFFVERIKLDDKYIYITFRERNKTTQSMIFSRQQTKVKFINKSKIAPLLSSLFFQAKDGLSFKFYETGSWKESHLLEILDLCNNPPTSPRRAEK